MRAILTAGLDATLLISASATGRDLRSQINERYQELNRAITKRDAKAVEGWISKYGAADLTFRSRDHREYTRKAFVQDQLQQISLLKEVMTSRIKVGNPTPSGSTMKVNVVTDLEGVITVDSKNLRIVDHSETIDVWVKAGADWKLKSITQTKADTQFFQK